MSPCRHTEPAMDVAGPLTLFGTESFTKRPSSGRSFYLFLSGILVYLIFAFDPFTSTTLRNSSFGFVIEICFTQ